MPSTSTTASCPVAEAKAVGIAAVARVEAVEEVIVDHRRRSRVVRSTEQNIVARPAVEHVVAYPADQLVGARAAKEHVVAAEAVDRVVTGERVDRIVASGSLQGVVELGRREQVLEIHQRAVAEHHALDAGFRAHAEPAGLHYGAGGRHVDTVAGVEDDLGGPARDTVHDDVVAIEVREIQRVGAAGLDDRVAARAAAAAEHVGVVAVGADQVVAAVATVEDVVALVGEYVVVPGARDDDVCIRTADEVALIRRNKCPCRT